MDIDGNDRGDDIIWEVYRQRIYMKDWAIFWMEQGNHRKKWQMIWDEKLYDLCLEMRDPTVYDFVVEDLYGFGSEMQSYIGQSIIDCTFGSESWSQVSEEMYPLVQARVDELSAT